MDLLSEYNELTRLLSSSFSISSDLLARKSQAELPPREICCCFSGHRDIFDCEISKKLETAVEALIKEGYRAFICGMAMGFDLMCAECVLKLKSEKYPDISLICAVPCPSQASSFIQSDKNRYSRILNNCENIIMVSDRYTRWCMHQRNRYMVNNSSALICYLQKESGGTYYTVEYAKLHKLHIINLAQTGA